MTGLAATLALDVKLQARSKLYLIGLVISSLLGLAGRFLFPQQLAPRLFVGFLFTGLGGTTFMFGASMVLLEKSEGTLQALRATPLSAGSYIASKVISLTTFATLEALVVYVVGFVELAIDPAPLLVGVVTLGALYTLVGLALVASQESVTSFLIPSALVAMALLQIPFLHLLELDPAWLWYAIPSQGSLLILQAMTQPQSLTDWLYAALVTPLAIGASAVWAHRAFVRHVGLQPSVSASGQEPS